ncbi:MAG: AAA family ATPase [Candidatus Spechtbacterales bacterium]
MYIKSLQLNNFKKFRDTKVDFPADITVLKGNNEAGKSTVREALVAALFFDPTSSNVPQYIKDHQSWHTEDLYQLNISFESGGENYILEKDFEKQRVFLKNIDGDILSHDFREVSAKLEELGGYSSKELFGNLSVIFRDSLILDSKDKKKIVERMRDMVAGTSSGASISQILKKLKKGFEDLTKGLDASRPVKRENYGKIKMIEENIKELRGNLDDMKKRLSEKEQAQVIFKEFEEKLNGLEKEKDLAQREYDANKQYFIALQESEKVGKELDSVLEDVNAFDILSKEAQELQSKIKETKPVTDKELERMEDATSKIRLNRDRLEELNSRISELKDHKLTKYYPSARLTFGVSFALILLGLLGFVFKVFFVSWILLGLFAAYMFISGKYSESVGLKDLEGEKEKREKDLKEYEKELEGMLSEFNLESPAHAHEHNKHIQEMKLRLESIDKQQKTLLRGKDIKQFLQKKKELERQLGIEQAKITEEQKTEPPTTKRQHELERQLEELDKEIKKTNNKYLEAKARLEGQNISQEDITETEEKISALKTSLERLKRRAELYVVVKDVLQEAQSRSLKKTREALERMMSEYIGQITSEKYTEVRLDDEFNLEVFSPEKDDYVDVSVLSTGAIDQLYIVSRFAFVQLLYNPSIPGQTGADTQNTDGVEGLKYLRRPVMLLDDPFVNFDEERKDNMRHVLKRLSHDFQIVLFTASPGYDTWGAVVEI